MATTRSAREFNRDKGLGAGGKSSGQTRAGDGGGGPASRVAAEIGKGFGGGAASASATAGRAMVGKTEGAAGPGMHKNAPVALPMEGPVPPGATPDVPNASLGQLAGLAAMLAPGGIGVLNTADETLDSLLNGKPIGVSKGGVIGQAIDSLTGQTPGKQEGWRADRYRGQDSMGGIGGSGGAVGSQDDPRNIPGRRYGAGTEALTGDPESTPDPYSDDFSDVVLRDRRKPKLGAGTQMLLG